MARRSVVIDLEVRNRQARKALQGVEGGFTRLSQKTQQSTQAMSQGFNRASQQVQGSQAAVSNLSRIVEDAPFGVRGVANNINPFIQSFGRMKQQAGSTGAAMKQLLTSAFTGPGAILTISALVTSSITAIQMGLFDWGEEAKSADEQMESLMETMDEFIDEQRKMGGDNIFDPLGQASTQQKLDQVQALKDELQSLFDLRKDAEELRQTISTLNQAGAGSDIGGAQDLLTEQSQKLKEVNKQIAEQEQLFGDLSEAQLEDIDKKIKDMEATEALNQAYLRLNPAMQQKLNLNNALRPVLRDVELGLEGSRKELDSLITSYEQQIEMLRQNIESGKLQGEELETNKQLLAAYVEALDRAKKAEEGITDEQKSAAEAAKKLAEARRELMDQARQRARPNVITDPSQQNTQFSDMGVQFPGMPEGGIDLGPAIGSLNELQSKLKELRKEWRSVDAGSERFKELDKEIQNTEARIDQVTGKTNESSEALMGFANMVGNAFSQAIIHGKELSNVLDALIAQLASRALITGLGAILTSGSSLGGGTFLEAVFSGFHQGTDAGFPGAGMVGERGKELLVAPPMSSIITNENVEKMHRMQSEAKSTATDMTSTNPGELAAEVRAGIESADIVAGLNIGRLVDDIDTERNRRNRLGNN